jgi:uncharacterized protein (DUF4415 family)
MADRRRTKSEERSHSELMIELSELELWSRQFMLKDAQIPRAWHAVEAEHPCAPAKTKITARLDADLVRFYRAMGAGYQARMNAILRAYMLAMKAKVIKSATDKDWKGDLI